MEESLAIFGSILAVLLFLLAFAKSKNIETYKAAWQPEWIISATFSYYIIAAPLTSILTNTTSVADYDFRSLIPKTIAGGIFGLFSIGIGIASANIIFGKARQRKITTKPIRHNIITMAQAVMILLFAFAFLNWASNSSLMEILLHDNSENQADSFENRNQIVAALLSLAIPITLLQISKPNSPGWPTVTLIIISTLLYIFIGSRNKLLFLLVGAACIHYLSRRKPPNLGVFALLAVIFYLGFSIIGAYRIRYGGLDFSQERSISEVLTWGFRDGLGVFFTFSIVLENLPSKFDFLYLTPIQSIPEYFIPRSIWPEKPELAPQLLIISKIIGTDTAREIGLAGPLFSDLYMIFGWISLLLGGIAFGFASRLSYILLILRNGSQIKFTLYACIYPFFYYGLSRGYFAQVIFDLTVIILLPALTYKLLQLLLSLKK